MCFHLQFDLDLKLGLSNVTNDLHVLLHGWVPCPTQSIDMGKLHETVQFMRKLWFLAKSI